MAIRVEIDLTEREPPLDAKRLCAGGRGLLTPGEAIRVLRTEPGIYKYATYDAMLQRLGGRSSFATGENTISADPEVDLQALY